LSENKILKAWGAGCTRNILLTILAFIVMMGLLLGLIILVVVLPISDDQRIYILVGGFLLIFFLMIAGVLMWGAWSMRQYARKLDTALTPFGLTGNAYVWNGRQYHGTLNGRQVDVYFYRGPSLDIYIASPLNTRMSIGLKGRFSQVVSSKLNRPELVTTDPDLDHISIFSLDERWGRELLDDPLAKGVILRLTAVQPGFEFRNLLFQPEAIHFQVHHISVSNITPENLRDWMYELLDLIKIAESLPAPSVAATASSLERKARLSRSDFTLPIAGITCGIIGLFTVLLIVGLFLLFFLQGGGI
jgi:hypothetical protein